MTETEGLKTIRVENSINNLKTRRMLRDRQCAVHSIMAPEAVARNSLVHLRRISAGELARGAGRARRDPTGAA